MTLRLPFVFASALLLAVSGCDTPARVAPTSQTCEEERVLETYHDREAMVIKAETYCLTVAPEDLRTGNYLGENVLVPSVPLPSAYQVVGLRVRISGRKKSCNGLTTAPQFRYTFGYKFELDTITGK
jgi:hypothetical protein